MDARLSHQDEHHGLGSWHPAMRPNTHDAHIDQTGLLARIHAGPSISANESEEDVQQFQLLSQSTSESHAKELQHTDGDAPSSDCVEGRTPEGRDESGDLSMVEPLSSNGMEVKMSLNPTDSGEGLESSTNSTERAMREMGQRALPIEDEIPCKISEASALQPGHIEEALGDKKEMDRAWEIQEKGLPIKPAASMQRTNSFPVVPPLQSKPNPTHSLPLSRVEGIIEDDETAEALDHGLSDNVFPTTNGDINESADPFEAIAKEEDDDYFNTPPSGAPQINTTTADAEEESRYDEGLPLMPSSQLQSTHLWDDPKRIVDFGTSEMADKSDFFDGSPSEPPEGELHFKARPLDRKSTTQVLNSMQYGSLSDARTEPQAMEARTLVRGTTEEDVPFSGQIVEDQENPEQQSQPSDSKTQDADLAEMWKAALGDDDVLGEDDNPVDPSAFFDDDDEGFLEGSQDQVGEHEAKSGDSRPALQAAYTPSGQMQGFGETNSTQATPQNRYQPATFSSNAISQQPPQATSFIDAMRQPPYGSQARSRPQMPASTQSFADKSKGGYTSPYDLPMDVIRPKKRNTLQQPNVNSDVHTAPTRPPPPRSSSMFTGVNPTVKPQPPVPRLPSAYATTQNNNAVAPPLKASPSMGSFFEELKPSAKPRPSSSMGRFTAPTHQPTPPPLPAALHREPLRQSSLTQPPNSRSTESLQPYQLLPPEKMKLYESGLQAEPAGHTVPSANARYSPAPPQYSSAPPSSNRYAVSSSNAHRPPPAQTLPFQPRTSSPLAQAESLPPQHQRRSMPNPSLNRRQSSGRQNPSAQDAGPPSLPQPDHQTPQDISPNAHQSESNAFSSTASQLGQLPSPTHPGPVNNVAWNPSYARNDSPPYDGAPNGQTSLSQNREMPSYAPMIPSYGPLRRSQTSSPGAAKYIPEAVGAPLYQRPASVNQHMSSPFAETRMPFPNAARSRGNTLSKELNYIRPTDGRELDPLERWKGSPIFSFGFGGAIVTSFPAQVPRYSVGQAAPMIKCSPGEIKLQDSKILPLDEDLVTFPGPLKAKSKRKDVVDWLQKRISKMENNTEAFSSSMMLPDPSKRHEEKVLLWKIVRVLVENDGAVDNNPIVEKAVRSILSPELTQGDDASLPPHTSNASLLGITPHSGSGAIPLPASPDAMEALRKMLLHGEREKAVWHAVDNRLWAHAMLISSTLEQGIWKQVSQEFVRQEVKTFGDNTEALAALYQVFAGNGNDSADELVPPSARAGLQMVSKTASTGPTKNAFDGLDRWRETLTLILSNRCSDDGDALMNLGRLLASYGRTEAAHICYIFARSPVLFGGPDDPQVTVALLGADHILNPCDYGRDLDNTLLTEVYDFSRTVLTSSSVATVSPHLQSFKLYHAMILAEYGYKSEAQQYCEVITSTLNSTTKRSPYYHNLLLGALDGLVERLRQAPKDNSGSWISKPSIDKVSGSLWAKFNQYVAGEESDAASTGSGKGRDSVAGPFAGVAGDSPTLSRAPSSNDLYNSYTQAAGVGQTAPMGNASGSRYAPAGLYAPRPSLEQQGRPTPDPQRLQQADTLHPALPQQQYHSRPTSSTSSQQEPYKPTTPSSYPARTESYIPTPPSQPQHIPEAPPEEYSSSLYQQQTYQPTPLPESQAPRDQSQHQFNHDANSGYQAPSSAYVPPSSAYEAPSTNGYEPPSSSGYDPPSYNAEAPLNDDSLIGEKPKKKSFMDDDEDDFEARAAALRREEKARKDREADEVFRRAAEADCKSSPLSTAR